MEHPFLLELYREFGVFFEDARSDKKVIFKENCDQKAYNKLSKAMEGHYEYGDFCGSMFSILIAFDATVFGSFSNGVYICREGVYVKGLFQEVEIYYYDDLRTFEVDEREKRICVNYGDDVLIANAYAISVAKRVEYAFNRYKKNR